MTQPKSSELPADALPQVNLPTPYQTVGPYFKIGLEALYRTDLTSPNTPGQIIEIEGNVIDADGVPVPDSVLEFWQADADGRYPGQPQRKPFEDSFVGFGRVPTDEQGRFGLRTIKPGAVQADAGVRQAPHILVSVFMRGLHHRLVTRIYFSDEAGNKDDPVLCSVEERRRNSLVARVDPSQPGRYEWNVFLQGDNETVFFDL
ncbi:MAG: protocatechuate 3,4-dioxygenase subunit alpha [Verrucomicrobia bacterium]|nr:protocatechuate 3,4-dioxygenase subunit alpha [Verrucomicrobiota bacterium]